MFYQTISKRSQYRSAELGVVSFVLTCKVHKVQLFAMFIWGSVSEQNARENVRHICDYLTGKYDGPFEGNITEAYLKLCENIHRFSDVFVAKNIS